MARMLVVLAEVKQSRQGPQLVFFNPTMFFQYRIVTLKSCFANTKGQMKHALPRFGLASGSGLWSGRSWASIDRERLKCLSYVHYSLLSSIITYEPSHFMKKMIDNIVLPCGFCTV